MIELQFSLHHSGRDIVVGDTFERATPSNNDGEMTGVGLGRSCWCSSRGLGMQNIYGFMVSATQNHKYRINNDSQVFDIDNQSPFFCPAFLVGLFLPGGFQFVE